MKQAMQKESIDHPDYFSVATLLYARLRRVSGRVIDVRYLSENSTYADHIMQLALSTQDAELARLTERLSTYIKLDHGNQVSIVQPDVSSDSYPVQDDQTEATAEEIYREQVSHHYIGALR